MINDIHVDLCFLGTDGFSNLTGPSTPSLSDAFLDRAIIAYSEKKYILGDYTKFQRTSLFKICDWSDITALITNDNADKEGVAEVAKLTTVITSQPINKADKIDQNVHFRGLHSGNENSR